MVLLLFGTFASLQPVDAVCVPGIAGEPICDDDVPPPPEPCNPSGGATVLDGDECPTPPPPCPPEQLVVGEPPEECTPTPDPCGSSGSPCDPCDEGDTCDPCGEDGCQPPCDASGDEGCINDPPTDPCENSAVPECGECEDGECGPEPPCGDHSTGECVEDPCEGSGCDPCPGSEAEENSGVVDPNQTTLNFNNGTVPKCGDPCDVSPHLCDGGETPTCEVPISMGTAVVCCLNTQGDEVAFNYLQGQQGTFFNAWVLEEMVPGNDNQKDIRVGWNNQYPQSDTGETITFRSSNDWQQAPWGQVYNPLHVAVFDDATGTGECGGFIRPSYGSATNPASVDVEAHFSGILVEKEDVRSNTTMTSTSYEASTTQADTWEVAVSYEASTLGPSGGVTGTISQTNTHTETYGGSDSATYQHGNSVRWTSTRSDFVMHQQPVS